MTNFLFWHDDFEYWWEASLVQLPPELQERVFAIEAAGSALDDDGSIDRAAPLDRHTTAPPPSIAWDDLTVNQRQRLVRAFDQARHALHPEGVTAAGTFGLDELHRETDTAQHSGSDAAAEPASPDPRRQRRDRFPQAFGKRIAVAELLKRWAGVERRYLESLAIDGDLTPYLNDWPVDIDQSDPRGAFRFMVAIEGPGTTAHRWLEGVEHTIVVGDQASFPALPNEACYSLADVLDWERANPALRPQPRAKPRSSTSASENRGRPKTIDSDLIDELIADYAKELRQAKKRFGPKDVIAEVCKRYAAHRPDEPLLKPDSVVSQRVREFQKKGQPA